MAAVIRLAGDRDAEAVRAVYAPYVRDTAISFELEPPTVDEMRRRIAAVLPVAPWLVCERDGVIAGYAYAGRFAVRPAYQWTMEVTVYVDSAHHRAGVGRALYTVLLDTLRRQGFRAAIGIIALPHPASVGLHERLGFRRVGVLPAIGFKQGRWHDVGYWELDLHPAEGHPDAPLPPGAVVGTAAWAETCARGAAEVAG